MSIASNFPAIKPTLLLDFANTEELDPRITFTRASTATYYGTQTAKAEENLLTYSQDIGNAIWQTSSGGVASAPTKTNNYGVAPDGTSTAGRLQFALNGGTATGDLSQLIYAITPVSGLPYTFSVWIKSTDGVSSYAMQLGGASAAENITVIGTWTRVTATSNGLGSSTQFQLRLRGGQTPTNSNSADILVWGFQLEQRSAVTAYTVTTTQPIANYIPQLLTAASGVARFDHNPTTFESLGLEIEEQRTNLLTYSEQFDNAAWTKSNASITANTVVAPDGTLTGDKLVEDTANSQHYAVQLTIPKPSANPTISVYAKAAGRNWIYLNVFPSTPNDFVNDTRAYFDLSTGTVGTVTRGTATIVSVGNGWYRCSLAASQFSSTASANCSSVIHVASANGTVSYTGDGYSGIYVWGAQLEAGAFATSYIPTVASQVTRANDFASITGTNFSSWYNQDQGTLYADSASSGTASVRYITNYNDGTTSNRIAQYFTATASSGLVTTNGTSQALLSTSAATPIKHALAYAVNDFIACANGGLSGADTGGVVPLVNQLIIGSSPGNTSPVNGTIKKIAYYPLRVTNAQLQGLTS